MAANKEKIIQFVIHGRWGGRTLICLYISILSGLVLALQYNPADHFYSTATIELIVPYGSFWRSLHYYSSQAFFLLLLWHLITAIAREKDIPTGNQWIRLTACIPIGLLLMFTGYVLRGDATGEAAGAIAEHITLSIPLLGKPINSLLFELSTSGVRKVYANHLIGLMVLGAIAVWPHLRKYTSSFHRHMPLTLAVFTTAVFCSAPMEPERFGLTHIAGPWFFLGLQEMLRYIPPFPAGVLIPSSLLLAVFLLPTGGKWRKITLFCMSLCLFAYTILSIISYGR